MKTTIIIRVLIAEHFITAIGPDRQCVRVPNDMRWDASLHAVRKWAYRYRSDRAHVAGPFAGPDVGAFYTVSEQ